MKANENYPAPLDYVITHHAQKRMQVRHIPMDAVMLALQCGRAVFSRGARVFFFGRKEIGALGGGLTQFDGIHVVTMGNTVVTVYRNRDFRSVKHGSWGKHNQGPARFHQRSALRGRSPQVNGGFAAMKKYDSMQVHGLGSGHVFHSGRLPEQLLWSEGQFDQVWAEHPLERHRIWMVNREVEVPRWQQAYLMDYQYTGAVNKALPTRPWLDPLLAWAQQTIDAGLNGALLNWYQGRDDYIGPHHDSITGLVPGSPIVTMSFGETRTFRLTRGKGTAGIPFNIAARPGAVFVLPYDTNLAWKHSVPKSARYHGRRISVTFRAFE